MSNQLTKTEQAKLQEACQAIRENIDTVMRSSEIVARSLRTIRDERLYRDAFLSFEEFCDAKFGISRQRAHQLIEFSKVLDNVNLVDTDSQINERQARELNRLPPEQQPVAWQEAVEATDGEPTAKDVKKAVEKRLPPKEIDTDETSRPQASTAFDDCDEQPRKPKAPKPKEASLEVNTLKELIENEKEKLTVFRWLWDSMLPWQRDKLQELIETWSNNDA